MAEGEPSIKDYLAFLTVVGVIVVGFLGYSMLTSDDIDPSANSTLQNARLQAETTHSLSPPKTYYLIESEQNCRNAFVNKSGNMHPDNKTVISEWSTHQYGFNAEEIIGGRNLKLCRWTKWDSYEETDSFKAAVFNDTASIQKLEGVNREPPFKLRIFEYKNGQPVKQLYYKIKLSDATAIE